MMLTILICNRRSIIGDHQVQRKTLPGLSIALLSSCLLFSTPVFAGDWYVSAAVTASFLHDPPEEVFNAPTPGANLFLINKLDTVGWGGQAALGHVFGPFRVEAEIGGTRNNANRYVTTSPIVKSVPEQGGETIIRYMANAYYDLPVRVMGIQPYLGAGLGGAESA
jgi:opacity protein-like surface antigen